MMQSGYQTTTIMYLYMLQTKKFGGHIGLREVKKWMHVIAILIIILKDLGRLHHYTLKEVVQRKKSVSHFVSKMG